MLYILSVLTYNSYILQDLSALGVAQKIQSMCFLQVNDLFTTKLIPRDKVEKWSHKKYNKP